MEIDQSANPDAEITGGDLLPATPIHLSKPDSHKNIESELASFGDKVKIYWPEEHSYHFGSFSVILDEGKRHIQYDDGDEDDVDLSSEK